jgi:hypothetical protein
MPELTYWSSIIAMSLLPCVILLLNIVGFFIIENFAEYGPFMVFSIWVQVGIFV